MTKSTESNCPKCGSPIPEDAPQNLCPKCVLAGISPTPSTATTVGGSRTAPPTVENVAAHFPELEIIEMIGAGGMGAVYKARQSKLDRFVALKILSVDLAADPAFAERFNREARVLARLNHPHIVTVYDFGTAGPFFFLLMEYVDGVNLRQAMRAGKFAPVDTLALVRDICAALKFAHEEGIMHRDIKPENVLIDSRGRVKIADFGIAKLVGEDGNDDVTLTMQGSVLGSPQYMAPEQIETPGDVDQRADIYSLGVVFYELLTGELPLGRFGLPSEKSPVDARIDEIVMRTLEKEREARFQSAGEVGTRIEAITRTPNADQKSGRSEKPPAPGAGGDEPAKFAFASAILTGGALLMALLCFFLLPILVWKGKNEVDPTGSLYLGLAWCTLLVGLPAFLGMLFGCRALGEIRRSGGRKHGLGSAMFGALTLPSIAIVAATGGLFVLLLKTTDTVIGTPLLIIAVAVAGALFVFPLIRKVASWARGLVKDEKPTTPRWQVALNLCLALVLAFVAYAVFFRNAPGHGVNGERSSEEIARREVEAAYERAQRAVLSNPYQELWNQHWQDLDPQFIGKLSVPRGHNAKIELHRVEQNGKAITTEFWAVEAPDDEPYEGVIALGAPEQTADQPPRTVTLRGTLSEPDGGNVRSYGKSYQGELKLKTRETMIAMETNPSYETELGTCSLLVDPNNSYDTEESTLFLRITSFPRAESSDSVPVLKPEDIPGIEMAYTAPAGRVSVFALQAPWDQNHEPPDDWYVVAPDDTDLHGRITVAITGQQEVGGKTKREVLATLLDGADKTLATHRFFMPEDHIVSLAPTYPIFEKDKLPDGEITGIAQPSGNTKKINLGRAGLHMVVFGHRQESATVDSLRLLAWSFPQPEGASVEDWMTHQQNRLKEQKWNPFLGTEKPLRIFDIEGDMRARAGMFFDTRQRILTRETELWQQEGLLITKGSNAKLHALSGGKFKIGPQADDALLIIQHKDHWIMPVPGSGLTLQVDELPGDELTIFTPFSNALMIREPAAFKLGGDGKLQVWEGKIFVSLPGGEEMSVTSGQAITIPKLQRTENP